MGRCHFRIWQGCSQKIPPGVEKASKQLAGTALRSECGDQSQGKDSVQRPFNYSYGGQIKRGVMYDSSADISFCINSTVSNARFN